MAYILTKTGIRKAEAYIIELEAKRKEILDAHEDTCNDTALPDIAYIQEDINDCVENGAYLYSWGVTDHYESDYPLCLQEGTDYVKECGFKENYKERKRMYHGNQRTKI